jgi:hypothetical protein
MGVGQALMLGRDMRIGELDGKATSVRFVCSSQGFQAKDKRDYLTSIPEPKLELDVKYAWDLH